MSPPFRPPGLAADTDLETHPPAQASLHWPVAAGPSGPSYRRAVAVGLLAAGVLGLGYALRRARSQSVLEGERVSLGMDIGSTYDEILDQDDEDAMEEALSEAPR